MCQTGVTIDGALILTEGSDHKNLATRHFVRQRHASHAAQGLQSGGEDVVTELLGGGGDTHIIEDSRVVITQTVTRKLSENGDHEYLGHSPSSMVRGE